MDEREFYNAYYALDTQTRNFWDWEVYRGKPRIVSRLPLGVLLLPGEGETLDLYIKGEGTRRPRLVQAGLSVDSEAIQDTIQAHPDFRACLEISIRDFEKEIQDNESVIQLKRDRKDRWRAFRDEFFPTEMGE